MVTSFDPAAFAKTSDTNGKKTAHEFQQEIDSLLQQVKKVAKDMDIDALDQLWNQLDEYQFHGEQQAFMNQINHAIIDYDIDFLQNI